MVMISQIYRGRIYPFPCFYDRKIISDIVLLQHCKEKVHFCKMFAQSKKKTLKIMLDGVREMLYYNIDVMCGVV
jgi:hypothetical protein